MTLRLAVTGRHGQVVTALLERADADREVDLIALGRPEFDLTDPASVVTTLAEARPDVIVSAAAYTAVDKAESEPDLAFAVNALGPGIIAQFAAERDIPVVHLSTDYVFAGDKAAPYTEMDPVGPTGVYGRTKLAGEAAVWQATPNSVILRTAWVYSPFGHNFVKTMLRLAGDRPQVRVVADQQGNPTSALDIADGVLAVARNLAKSSAPELRGVFHMTASGTTNWSDFARAIFQDSSKLGGPAAEVASITTADYPTPARRPANSALDSSKLATRHGVRLPAWQTSLETVVRRLLNGR